MNGKIALVTGASSGIGAATARAMAAAGATVVAGARRVDRLEELAATADGEVFPVELDVADQQSVREAVATAVSRFGGLDVVVNNAGVMLSGPIVGADTAEWDRMVRTNLLGTLYVTHAALPHLLARKGTVVQISSTSGRVASAMGGVYAATKFGVNAFTESLRQEVTEQGVRVVTIEPGMVDTELADHIGDETIRDMAKKMADSMRTLRAEDVAAAVVYAVGQPDHVAVNEILLRPTDQVR
ncbi:SDR family NAD(P)-dependent oxidoreductase [Amycolatopsis sp. SID8362]|uniref:SDR family NAD(P)-dependent oxidoreductase n=1 Tax=Amycolatopsis sp. SID8362 TaxID=2690346 RepID=UPI00136F2001|nr:SDR family NAD(P)-dependent oxidoreductase [Amycolatopsis sp. SID8362]NBH10485.1 SDR family NAD(P)-dependent oxidoreductase [Amycolatopsis sp. SID8362]NED47179.1 SDR family NAD(P)-dependent oxidoreductase [Amycolatopsis sp. SID8362]